MPNTWRKQIPSLAGEFEGRRPGSGSGRVRRTASVPHQPAGSAPWGMRSPGRGGAFLPDTRRAGGRPSGGPWRTLANSRGAIVRGLLSTCRGTWGLDVSNEANTRLADLFGLTGWSKGELARLVNRQAAAMGHPQLATDTSRVRRWIDTGESPREPVPKVLAALFTERLGRVVTIEDLGFDRRRQTGKETVPGDGLPWPPERTAAVLTEFTGMDLMLNRRGLVGAGAALASGTVLSTAMYDWLHTDPALAADAPSPRRSAHRRSRRLRPLRGGPDRLPGDRVAGALGRGVPRLGRLPRRRTPAQGGGRPAQRGGRHALLPPSRRTSSGGCGAWPPTSRCSPGGCRTTWAWSPPPRSTS